MPKIPVSDTIYWLLIEKAKREGKKLPALVNELMNKALWKEPEFMFKGKKYRIDEDIFGYNVPKENEFDE